MNNLIHFIRRNVARLLEKRIKNELPVFESSESICRVIIVIVIVIITIEYRHVGKQCNDKRTWTTSNITLIQHFDRLYPETSDRYRLTPRNTASKRAVHSHIRRNVCACSLFLLSVLIQRSKSFGRNERGRETITFRFIRFVSPFVLHAQVA